MRHTNHLRSLICIACTLFYHVCGASLPLLGTQQIAAGGGTTCAVVNGAVQCWGANVLGKDYLNAPIFYQSSSPVALSGLGAISQVTVGSEHICSLSGGFVKCWGESGSGQTGPNGGNFFSPPVAVDGATSGVSSVVAGGWDTCAIVNGGAICWGDNFFGQLGSAAVPTGFGGQSSTPVAVAGLGTGVTKIAVGTNDALGSAGHVCAIVGNIAKCWGDNQEGQLGHSTIPALSYDSAAGEVSGLGTGVTDVAVGDTHSCAVVNGAAYCWGSNYAGELGSGSVANSYSQTPVAVQGLGIGVVAISASSYHACALVNNDAAHPIKCWGENGSGQLGNGTAADSATPTDVAFFPTLTAASQVAGIASGGAHTCAVIVSAGVSKTYCWGSNASGQLGKSDAPISNPTPQSVVGISSGVTGIATGSDNWHQCAVVNGGAQCWGSNGSGQLGDGLYINRSIALGVSGLASGVSEIADGGDFSCAVVSGAVKCWGGGYHGVLGNNSQASQTSPVQVTGLTANVTKIAASGGRVFGVSSFGGHVCAIVSGSVQCWGDNFTDALGNPSVESGSYSLVPVAVTGIVSATDVAVTSTTSCVIVNSGVQCWGKYRGNLADQSPTWTPISVTGLGSGVTALVAGSEHFCALQSGSVMCWGDNYNGQLGNQDASGQPKVEPVAVVNLSNVTALAAGGYHTCAAVSGGVECWGSNANFELGAAVSRDCLLGPCSGIPVAISGLSGGVVALGAGSSHTCALIGNSSVKCWGGDFYGQLGDARFLSAETPQVVNLGEAIFKSGFEP